MAPGVGYYNPEKHTLMFHTYYQWAPLVLFLNGARFYLPRLFWKIMEAGRMETITHGMKHQVYSAVEFTSSMTCTLLILWWSTVYY